jgi:predicted small metal-binding protein
MREFKCASLGNACNWKHVAKTEDLLVDMAALHLRDVHGVTSISPEMVGKIKSAFTAPATPEAEKAADLVMREFHCKDLGNDCPWKYIAQTEELIADGVAVHLREAHGVKEFSQEMKVKVEKSLHEWKG